MVSYVTATKFEATTPSFSIRLSFEHPLSYGDLAEVLRDIESIYASASREVTPRDRGSNAKKRDAILVAKDFRSGSLEILTDPYVAGTITGVMANTIFATFIYVMRRIGGRPANNDGNGLPKETALSEDKLREAANKSVNATAKARRELRKKVSAFGLSITISWNGREERVTED